MNKKHLLAAILCAIIAATALGGCGTTNTGSSQSTQSQTQHKTESQVMYDRFLSLKMGTSYEEVKKTLGSDGKLHHENQVGNMKTQAYEWQDGKAHITCMFQNGTMTAKSMADLSFLKPNGKNISSGQFEQIKTSMTYDQVKRIFNDRDGFLLSQIQIAKNTTQIYMWINEGGANVQATFINSTVHSKTQTGLK